MDTVVKRLYEGMFLVDSGDAASDWDGTIKSIEKVISRAEGEVVSLRKWDERRLAYDVNGKGRGTYILVYFNVDPLRITSIERDVQLSEQITRVLVLRTDRMSQEDIDRPTPAMAVEIAAEKAAAAKEKAAEEKAAEEKAAAEAAAQAEAESDSGDQAASEEDQPADAPAGEDVAEVAEAGEEVAEVAQDAADSSPQPDETEA
ncbi:MAG: 30S ribosomal protein S6 [Planctomycetes bacterium]|nr:30S ribosomal protein S6 [Planctomycetota bacterium]